MHGMHHDTLRFYENKMLWRTRRKLYNRRFYIFFFANIINSAKSKSTKWVGNRRYEKCIYNFTKESVEKRPLMRFKRKLEDHVEMDVKELEEDLIHLT